MEIETAARFMIAILILSYPVISLAITLGLMYAAKRLWGWKVNYHYAYIIAITCGAWNSAGQIIESWR